MMKIAVVTPWFPNKHNSASGIFVLKDVKALLYAGEDVTVIHLTNSVVKEEKCLVEGVKTIRIPMSTFDPLSIFRASRMLPKYLEKADILHTQALSAIEPFVFKKPNIPWVHTEHWSGITTPETLSKTQRVLLPVLLKMAKLPDVVVSVCDFLAQPLRAVRNEKPVRVIPCQVPAPLELIERPKLTETIRLVSTGALIDRKDPLIAIRTLRVLKDRGIQASLVWLGDGDLRESCIKTALELEVDAFFPGTKTATEVQEFIAASDMFFGPTKADNFFVAAAESIVNGRPLVVGANGGQGEYISPKVGTTVVLQDEEAYADAIIQTYEKTKLLSAKEIADTVGNRFEPNTIANSYIQLYEELV